MARFGIVQTTKFSSNEIGKKFVSKELERLGKKETEIVCLPEQWQNNNLILDYDTEFAEFKKIAKEFSMTIIAGAFFEKNRRVISSPVIGPNGEIIGKQEKIHPFDYEKNQIVAGSKTRLIRTSYRFGIIICYDMVFADVANSFAKKGAQVLFSPARIVKRGIMPWHIYVQTRALENRIPVLAANIKNQRFGGNSIIVDLVENDNVMIPKMTKLGHQYSKSMEFDLKKYEKSRKQRFADHRKFS